MGLDISALNLQDAWAVCGRARAPWQTPLDRQQPHLSVSVFHEKVHHFLCMPWCEQGWKVLSYGIQITTSITTMLSTEEVRRKYDWFFFSMELHFIILSQESHLADFFIIFTFPVMSPTAYFGEKVEFSPLSVLWLINESSSSEKPTEDLMDWLHLQMNPQLGFRKST